MSAPVPAEALVNAILQPLGTRLVNYMPVHREQAIRVADTYLRGERAVQRELAEALRAVVRTHWAEAPDALPTDVIEQARAALAKAGL